MRLSLLLFVPLVSLSALMFARTQAADLLPADRPLEEVIDHYIDARLLSAGVPAAPQAEDANLARRLTLDLVGRIPVAAEAKSFSIDADSAKRAKLVDRLMSSPNFARHQSEQFDTLLMEGTRESLREYLLTAFRENRPWDRMFRDMILGETGDDKQKGSIQFLKARAGDLDKLANEVSVVFFGVNVSCAKCHDHPLVPDWTQNHFYGMKSFFSRVYENGGFLGERDYGFVSYKTKEGESRDAKLMFLTGELLKEPDAPEPSDKEKKEEKQRLEDLKKNKEPPPAPKFSRRALIVDVALKADPNGTSFFSRAIVNHVWNRFFGRGLVSPVDQMHVGNPPSHPELLDWMARDFVAHGYDLRRLTRGVVMSRAYSRSSVWNSNDKPLPDLFAVATPRPLSPLQYGTTLRLAAANPDQFPNDLSPEDLQKRISGIEGGGRGLSGMFEQPGEDFQVSVDEALLLSNSDRLEKELLRTSSDGLLAKLIATPDRKVAIETATWTAFNRPPTVEEWLLLEKFLESRTDRLEAAYRQMVWAMLTSSECRFNY